MVRLERRQAWCLGICFNTRSTFLTSVQPRCLSTGTSLSDKKNDDPEQAQVSTLQTASEAHFCYIRSFRCRTEQQPRRVLYVEDYYA